MIDYLLSETIRKYQECGRQARQVPPWLQQQVRGIYAMNDNYERGLMIYIDGLNQERERLEELEGIING